MFNDSLALSIQKQAGRYFRLIFTVVQYPNISVSSSTFMITPSALKLAFGTQPTDFSANGFPQVVRLDGNASDAPNMDGLPAVLTVHLMDNNSNVLEHANCQRCFAVRLVLCDDSVYNNGTTAGDTAANWAPSCPTTWSDSEADNMAGSTQARCATSSADGLACSSSSAASDQFVYTLSNSSGSAGGTLVDVVNGIATFSNLQPHYVVGAGYRLRFVLDPKEDMVSSFDVQTWHSAAFGNVFLPDIGSSVAASVTSFFVRPHSLDVVQHPGGDGTDLGTAGGDRVENTPDGVGRGITFRVQPAVVVKGDGYFFTKDWNTHGHAPITAMIKGTACGGNCSASGLVLSGSVTPVTSGATSFVAVTVDGLEYSVTADGTSSSSSQLQGTPSGNDGVHLLYSQPNVVTFDGASYSYDSSMLKVGFKFKDLALTTSDANTAQQDVVLAFLCGIDTANASAVDTGSGGKYTVVDSRAFNVFVAPDPPTSLRVTPYQSKGFRVEFAPPPVSVTMPLSGFLIEIDVCDQSTTGLTGSASTSGSCPPARMVYDATYELATELGSDYFLAGGTFQDIILTYGSSTGGQATSITASFNAVANVQEGDSVSIELGMPGVLYLSDIPSMTLEGTDSSRFEANFTSATSTVVLVIGTGNSIFRGEVIEVTIAASNGIPIPDSATQRFVDAYGNGSIPSLPNSVVAPLTSSQGRLDNCKGSGCVASATYQLPSFQDSTSMDEAWSGTLRYSAYGTSCSRSLPWDEAGVFPSNRFCTLYGPSSNAPLTWTAGAPLAGGSGENGSPIGRNPGSGSATSGSEFTASDADCRDGTATQNPCMLSVGSDWTLGATLSYSTGSDRITQVSMSFTRERMLTAGDVIQIVLAGATHNATSASGTVNVTVDGSAVGDWTASWFTATSTLSLTVNASVLSETPVSLTLATSFGLIYPASGSLSTFVVGNVFSGNKATIIFRNGAIMSSSTDSTGDPVASYSQGGTISIGAGDIVRVRVYAYNGRFRSTAAQTEVLSRAIQAPDAPSYFSQRDHEHLGVALDFSPQNASTATQVKILLAPFDTLLSGATVSIVLPAFSGPDATFCASGCDAQLVDDFDSGTSHDVFTSASWTLTTQTLILTVGSSTSAIASNSYTVVAQAAGGILYPTNNTLAYDSGTGLFGQRAALNSFSFHWVSPFPLSGKPRKGFLVQYTPDEAWQQDIETAVFVDDLSNAPGSTLNLFLLSATISANTTSVPISSAYPSLVDKYIKVEDEVMLVTAASSSELTVVRARKGTVAIEHGTVAGGGNCSCSAAGVVSGVPSTAGACACVHVAYVNIGATDINQALSGLEYLSGFGSGVACPLGQQNWNDWCNPRTNSFLGDLRTYQKVTLRHGLNAAARWVGPCSGLAEYTSCSLGSKSQCACTAPHLYPGAEFGTPLLSSTTASLLAVGNPLDYPLALLTTLRTAVEDPAADSIVMNSIASISVGDYLQINSEVVLVTELASFVSTLQLVNGGSGCTSNGTLRGLGGKGSGFSGTFTINNAGAISSVSLTSEGTGYTTVPAVQVSDAGCVGLLFRLTLDKRSVRVERGVESTSAADHTVGTSVFSSYWLDQRDRPGLPGVQYHFRVAAYNNAGLSNWLYYNLRLFDAKPRFLPSGGTLLEIVLLGGGVSTANVSVYIGAMANSTAVDVSRSKRCQTLEVKDPAGTRLVCRTPIWVGKQHSLIVRVKSGMLEQFAVGQSWLRYEAPRITGLIPGKVVPPGPTTVTIIGANFGRNVSDVSGRLVTDAGPAIPCSPLVLVSDSQVLCNITGQSLQGNMELTVGTFWSGGAQTTSKNADTALIELEQPVTVYITLAIDIQTIPPDTFDRAAFIRAFVTQTARALRVPESRILVVDILPGSIIVVVALLPDLSTTSPTPSELATLLQIQIANPDSEFRTSPITGTVLGISGSGILPTLATGTSTTGAAGAGGAGGGGGGGGGAQPAVLQNFVVGCKKRGQRAQGAQQDGCFNCCMVACEFGAEEPLVSGKKVAANLRGQLCRELCYDGCGSLGPQPS